MGEKNQDELKKIRETMTKLREAAVALDKYTKEMREPILQKLTIEALKKKGYDVAPQPSMPYGRPDIIATKGEEGVSPSDW